MFAFQSSENKERVVEQWNMDVWFLLSYRIGAVFCLASKIGPVDSIGPDYAVRRGRQKHENKTSHIEDLTGLRVANE